MTLRVLAVALALLTGCSLPSGGRGTPEEAHYAVLTARRTGDPGALWDLLHPDDRARFDAWIAAEKEAVRTISLVYPEPDRAPALAALADGRRASLEDGRALFVALASGDEALAGGTPLPDPGPFATLGARARAVAVADDLATVRTWGGDEILLRRGPDDVWYATLPPEVVVGLDAAVERAKKNLTRVRANVAKLAHKAQ